MEADEEHKKTHKKIMKIAFIYPHFYPAIGGVENYIKSLADEYSKTNHEVAIFCAEASTQREKSENQNAQTQERAKLPYPVYPLSTKKIGRYQIPNKKKFTSLNEFQPDVLHYSGPHPFSTAIAWHLRKKKAYRVLTYHAHVNPQNPIIKVVALIERRFYKKLFDRIIVTSDYYKTEVSKFFPAEKMSVIPPAVGEEFKTSKLEPLKKFLHRKPHILFIGALDKNHQYKGINIIIKCAQETPNYHYTIIGDGELKEQFIKKTTGLTNIEFLGRVPSKKLRHYYQSSNLFVLPSTSSSEGFGIVLLEAMACGTPTLTTDKVGSSTLLKEKNASYIVKANDSNALKQGIETVLNDKDLQNQLTANGTKMARSLTWPLIASKTLKSYRK